MNDEKLLLNEKEASQLLGMSTHFLRRDRISAVNVGIPFVRIGASIRYRRVDLEVWIAEQIDRQLSVRACRGGSQEIRIEEPRRRGRPRKTQRRVPIQDTQ